jgi:hypothetical protein
LRGRPLDAGDRHATAFIDLRVDFHSTCRHIYSTACRRAASQRANRRILGDAESHRPELAGSTGRYPGIDRDEVFFISSTDLTGKGRHQIVDRDWAKPDCLAENGAELQ